MKKSLLLILLFVSTAFTAIAQEFELGEVTIEELKEESNQIDPSASAAILYKTGTTYFDIDKNGNWLIVTDVSVRLKIYNKDGYDYATVEVPFYTGSSRDQRESVIFKEGWTYNLEGGKIDKSKLKREGKFTEEINDIWSIEKITLPAVKEGSVIEYRYIKKSPYIRTIPTWYFQEEIPINSIHYTLEIPQYFIYNRILSPYMPVEEDVNTERVTKEYSSNGRKSGYGQVNTTIRSQMGSVSYYVHRKKYMVRNVSPLKDESFVDNIDNYRSYVKHELAKTNFPNDFEKNYATDWTTVVKSIYNDEDFGRELNKSDYFEDDIKNLLKDNKSGDDAVTAIYKYVQNRMTYNDKYGYECRKGVEKAYEEKTGNAAEINLMLVAMLRYAGFNANPVLLSTRDNGHVAFVNRNEFNYVVAGLESQDNVLFLDATTKKAAPGLLPVRALNIIGRVVRDNLSSEQVSLIPSIVSIKNNTVLASIDEQGNIEGQVRRQYFDYNAFMYRIVYGNIDEEEYLIKQEKKLDDIEISDYTVENRKDNYSDPVVEKFSFVGDGIADVVGDKIYISPMLFFSITENPFKLEERNYPVDFVFPSQDKHTINLNIPEGYVIESVPDSMQIMIEGNVCTFTFKIGARGNMIQVVASENVNVSRINPEYYKQLKDFYSNIVKKQGEKIVLKKA